jgi:hypothetical protein
MDLVIQRVVTSGGTFRDNTAKSHETGLTITSKSLTPLNLVQVLVT